MGFSFESVTIFGESPVFRTKFDGVDVGSVFRDEEKGVWKATRPNLELDEPEDFKTKEDAANHLAKIAGLK